ncbi:MAG: hypothetical protein AB7D41_08090 [Arcobacter sp.]|uniref:hypothetical protein n=1 Tax=Arcobacter sp. TaxID=1872629 RepID=UPI003CFFF385
MTEKEYQLRELNEKFYKKFYIPKMTCKKIESFVKQGGDLNYTRNGKLENIIWEFLDEENMKYINIFDCLIKNGLNINTKIKFDGDSLVWEDKEVNILIYILKMFSSDYYRAENSEYYDKKNVLNFVKYLIKNGSELPIFIKDRQKYLDFDSLNKYDIYNELIKDGFKLPKNIKLYKDEENISFNKQLDEVLSIFDEHIKDSKSDVKKYTKLVYTFEDWALEYLPNYEKGMEIYEGDIECFPKIINNDTYDFEDRGSILYSKNITSLKGCPKIIKGNFNCSKNELESLEYGPREVLGNFDCSNNYLESLKYSPEIVHGNFNCSRNKLRDLRGISKDIRGYIDCIKNYNLKNIFDFVDLNKNFVYHSKTKIEQDNVTFKDWYLYTYGIDLTGIEILNKGLNCRYNENYNPIKITSLEGCPKIINGEFDCSGNKLKTLEHAPQKIFGRFNCSKNQIISLKGGPKFVQGVYDCSYNQLNSLEGGPEEIEVMKDESFNYIIYNNYNCEGNKLTSLEYMIKLDDRYGSINASWNKLETLKGLKNKKLKSLKIISNKLTSLKYCPEIIHEDFMCSENNLETLEFGPLTVGHYFRCNNNKLRSLKFSPKEVPYIFDCSNNLLVNLEDHPLKVGVWSECQMNRLKSLKGIENCKIMQYINVSDNPELKKIDYKPLEGKIKKD